MESVLVKTKYVENKWQKIAFDILPYIVILIASMIAGVLLFYEGTPTGDDIGFHYANIYYMFKAIKNNESLLILSETFGGIGYAKGLFYSPLSHTVVALTGVLLEPFGITLMQSFKIVIFITLFLSGVFMYRFSMHITENKRMSSIVVAVLFVIMPYRLFNYFARFAFAEAFAILFLPLFFMGLYDFTHLKDNDDFNVLLFYEIILGAIGTYLSHNITGLFALSFGIVYLLCYIDKIIKKLINDKKFLIYTLISIGLILGLLSLALVRTLTVLNTGIYNVSNSDRMWTNFNHVADDTSRSAIYTGFVNMDWLRSNNVSISDVLISFVAYIVSTSLYVISNFLLSKVNYKKFKWFAPLISVTLYLLVSVSFNQRIEFMYSVFTTSIIILFISYLRLFFKEEDSKSLIYKDRFLYVCSFLLIFALLLLTQRDAWRLLPSIFYTVQFAWRINSIISILVPMLLAFVLRYYSKQILIIAATVVGLIPLLTQVTIEKRVVRDNVSEQEKNEYYDKHSANSGWRYEIDGEINPWYYYQVGYNMEYFPYLYGYYNEGYEPVYSNSLYYFVYSSVGHGGTHEKADGKYSVLEGSAIVDEESIVYNAPITSLSVNVTSLDSETNRAVIQVAVIYYPGYKVRIENKDTGEVITKAPFDPEATDYLLAVDLGLGNYNITFDYKGTGLMKVSNVIYFLSIVSMFGFAILDSFYIIDKKKKEYIKY